MRKVCIPLAAAALSVATYLVGPSAFVVEADVFAVDSMTAAQLFGGQPHQCANKPQGATICSTNCGTSINPWATGGSGGDTYSLTGTQCAKVKDCTEGTCNILCGS